MHKMTELFKNVDVFASPSFEGGTLLMTNLTGNPTVVVPNGVDHKGNPTSLSFVGDLYKEAEALRVAKAYQDATEHHLRHPRLVE
jgi:Asp-tRNA(Asn)/Glu-tRNA(Gln) amidotransferase A subunit family amidase